MKIALLMGNRFNPWHLKAYHQLRGGPEVVAFRAESEIQRRFEECDDGTLTFPVERIFFDYEHGPFARRLVRGFQTRHQNREPRIAPFSDRLRGYDLIQSSELFTDWTAQAVEAKERDGTPLALMVWDNIPFNQERNDERRAMKQRAARTADRFIVHTERSRRTLDFEGVPKDRIVMMDPGVDTELFKPGPPDRARFGLAEDEFVLLFVGWLLPRKGIDFVLLALRELVRDSSLRARKYHLVVVGDGPGKDRVESLIDRVGVRAQVTFTGPMPYNEMAAAFRSADLFVLPSIATPEWQEQFGMALIEAMACGTPVITTYSGAIPEIAGDAAVLCQPNDFVSLYEAIRSLAGDAARRKEMGEAGRARALERFTLPALANALSGVYESMLRG